MFNIIELLFPVIFILIFIMIIFTFAKGISTWHKNNNSPRLTVSARIVAKTPEYHVSKSSKRWRYLRSSWISYNIQYYLLCHFSSGKR